jgi:hypothetical protein
MTLIPSSHPISLYAEHLSNIRLVSVVASLSSLPDASTKAQILDDGQTLQVHHQGCAQDLTLPTVVSNARSLLIPSNTSNYLNWRLPVPPVDAQTSQFSPEDQAIPWSSTDMRSDSPICCRRCDQVIVQRGGIKTWKDLPSENWAEMMEFWHCHKPSSHDQPEDNALAAKGYAANSAITAQPGICLADITSFVLFESDCSGLSVSSVLSPTVPFAYSGWG